MKKLFGILLVVVMLLGSGLGYLAPTSTAAPKEAVYKWKMQTCCTRQSGASEFEAIRIFFVEPIQTMSGGRIEIQLFGSGEIVKGGQGATACAMGQLDLVYDTAGYYVGTEPTAAVEFGLPGTFRNAEEWLNFYYHWGFRDFVQDKVFTPKGLKHLGPWANPGMPLLTKKPIMTLDDLKGKKIRSIGSVVDFMRIIKATPISIPMGEVYTSLAQGVIDGAGAGPYIGTYNASIYEVAPYSTTPVKLVDSIGCRFEMNLKLWNSLPPDLQEIIQQAAISALSLGHEYIIRVDNDCLRKMQAKGLNCIELPEQELDKWQIAAAQLWDKIAKQGPVQDEAIAMLKDYMEHIGRK